MKFIVTGKLRGKGRPRFTRSGIAYTPKETTEYEKRVKYEYLKSNGQYFDADSIEIYITAYYKIPKSANKALRDDMEKNIVSPNNKTPDIDNIVKIVLDWLNGVAYKDDKQVCKIVSTKMFSYDERLEIGVYKYFPYGVSNE